MRSTVELFFALVETFRETEPSAETSRRQIGGGETSGKRRLPDCTVYSVDSRIYGGL